MRDYLRREEFVPFAPKERGEQVHIHHCKQGHNNDRLYIRRTEDDTILAFCHHCSKRGVYRDTAGTLVSHKRAVEQRKEGNDTTAVSRGETSERKTGPISLEDWCKDGVMFKDMTFEDASKLGVGWFFQYRIKLEHLRPLYLKYRDGRWWLPCVDSTLNVVVEIGRKVNNLKKGEPKWWINKFDTAPWIPYGHGKISSLVVLTEDIISAYRVYKATGYHAYPLLGTSVNDAILNVLKKYDEVLIWLDDDNMEVKNNQLKILNKVKLLVPEAKVISGYKQPKELTDASINAIISTSTK